MKFLFFFSSSFFLFFFAFARSGTGREGGRRCWTGGGARRVRACDLLRRCVVLFGPLALGPFPVSPKMRWVCLELMILPSSVQVWQFKNLSCCAAQQPFRPLSSRA